jgi:hypothetical protein
VPRPEPARLATRPSSAAVDLTDDMARRLDRLVPREALNPEFFDAVSWSVAAYKSALGRPGASVADTIELLRRIADGGRKRKRALRLLAHERSGVDEETHGVLRPFAIAALAGNAGAMERLAYFAEARIHKLNGDRFEADTQALAGLCGVLNLLFRGAHGIIERPFLTNAERLCRRRFAQEVFTAGEIKTPDFGQHPERLDELLDTDIVPHWTVFDAAL